MTKTRIKLILKLLKEIKLKAKSSPKSKISLENLKFFRRANTLQLKQLARCLKYRDQL